MESGCKWHSAVLVLPCILVCLSSRQVSYAPARGEGSGRAPAPRRVSAEGAGNQTQPIGALNWGCGAGSSPAPAERFGSEGQLKLEVCGDSGFREQIQAGDRPPVMSLAHPTGNCKQVAPAGRSSRGT